MPTPKKKPLEEGYMEVSVRYGNTCAAIRDCFASSTRAYLELCEVKDPSVKKEGSVVLSLSLYTGPSKDSRGRAQKRHRLVIGGVGVPELFLTGDTKVMLWTHTQVMLVVQIADFITLKIKPDKQSSGAGQSLQGWRDSMKKLENSVKKEETKLNKERTDALLDEAQHFPANRERALASFHLHRAALATAPTLKELKKNVLMEDPNDATKLDRAKEYKSKKATAWVLPFSVWDPVTKIGKLGLALELYFSQVRTLVVVMLILAALSGRDFYLNVLDANAPTADDEAGEAGPIARTTLGMRGAHYAMGESGFREMVASVVFISYLIWLRWWAVRVAENNNEMHVTPADYTIEVTGLPEGISKDEVRKFFQAQTPRDLKEMKGDGASTRFGEAPVVKHISMTYTAVPTLVTQAQKIKSKTLAIKETAARVIKQKRSKDSLNKQIKDLVQSLMIFRVRQALVETQLAVGESDDFEGPDGTTVAYVTFESAIHARAAAHRWKYTSVWRRIFDALTCGCSAAKKGPPIREGFRPVCKRAPEPTDLLWQHASKAARENVTKRTILSIVVATVLLLVTFGFVYSMVLFKSNMAFEFEDAANAEEMAAAFGKGEGGLEEAGGLMSRLSFWLANWINEFAADYVSGNQMMTIVMSGAISCFTVAANFALRKIMEVMTSFERHSSLSNFGVSLLHKLSAVYICNYIVVYFFVYSAVSLHGLSDALHSIVVDMLAQLNIDFSSWGWLHDSCADTEGDVSECHASALNEAFADANWYSDTGLLPQMVVIALVDASFLVGNEVIEVFIFPMLSIAWGRLTKYSQDGLDEAYSPPQFKLADKYAYIIKHVAICLTFGSACPLLYCICFVALAMMYVCQKAALVMYYARPSVTEDSLAEAFRDQLTILLFMHVAFSFVFFAKQEFDVYGIGADRFSAFALGSAPFGVALLAAFAYYVIPFEQMLARDVKKEASGTKGAGYSSYFKAASYLCPTKLSQVDGELEKVMSARSDRVKGGGNVRIRKAHVFDFLGEKNVDIVEGAIDKINPCVKGCTCCKAKFEKEAQEMV